MASAIVLPAYAQVAGGRTVFGFVSLTWALTELWIVSRDRAKVSGRRADRGSRGLIVAAVVTASLLAPWLCAVRAAAIPLAPRLLTIVGIALMLSGIAFRLWSVRTLGRFFRVTVTTHDDHRLIDHGPYRRLRNPSYTGAMITLAGMGIATGNAASLAVAILLPLAAFAWRIKVEEASLGARFGADYAAFRARRWALVPFLW